VEMVWYLHDEVVGKSIAEKSIVHSTMTYPPSILRYCFECGSVWSRIYIKGQRWISESRLCDKCGPGALAVNENIYKHKYPWPDELDLYEIKVMQKCGGMRDYEIHLITGGM